VSKVSNPQNQKADDRGTSEQSEEQLTKTTQDQELAVKVDLLAAENRRLRELVAATQQTQYRNTAIALGSVGIICGALGLIIPAVAEVLFALGGIGVFGGVLTYFLTPERFISADVGQQVYAATAESFERLCRDLGLSDKRIYIPAPETEMSDTQSAETQPSDSVGRLFIPQTTDTEIPDWESLNSSLLVEHGQRGLSLSPTGGKLFTAVTRSLTEPLGSTPEVICEQLSDAIIEDFELAQQISYEADSADGRVSVQIQSALYGDGTRFDHPIVSLLAVGLARGLERPIEPTVTAKEPLSITYRWESEDPDYSASDEG
jgi:hypothetical protein